MPCDSRPARALACLLAGLLAASAAIGAQLAVDVPPSQLRAGEYLWHPEAAPAGPLLLVVSLPEQRAYLYRNGVRIAVTTVSSGKAGRETPAGVFTVLQKQKEHFSNLYDDAPMPYMQRLTWTGIALHAGRLPGFPASHGCVRLPMEFARRLYSISGLGMTVVVADGPGSTPGLAHPGWLAPGVPGVPASDVPFVAGVDFSWQPERSASGPLTVLLTGADHRARVLRNGVEIGSAPFQLDGDGALGTHVLQLQSRALNEESRYVPGRPRLDWTLLRLDAGDPRGTPVDAGVDQADLDAIYRRIHVPAAFARLVYAELAPGTTIVLTDLPADAGDAGQPVLDTDDVLAAPMPAGAASPSP